MKIKETKIKGCYLLSPEVYYDQRGSFVETYNKKEFEKCMGQQIDFVQDNQSISKKGALRGLHFQKGKFSQAKLVRVVKGEVLDVVVDLRSESATYGEHFKIKLTENDYKMLFIPKGLAHGFLSLSNETIFTYKCDEYYNRQAEGGIVYNDSELNIDWELDPNELIISEKDRHLPTFKEVIQ